MIKKTSILISSILLLLLCGGLFFAKRFFSALAPPQLTITTEYISTNRDFINGVSIEKIYVDSIGKEGYPIKYTTFYTASCNIQHPINEPLKAPNKIEFYKQGKYWWNEDTIKISYIHNGLSRQSLDTTSKLSWLNKFGKHSTCPIKFKQEQWYFITIGDPQVTGLFYYIDKDDQGHHYYLKSGV